MRFKLQRFYYKKLKNLEIEISVLTPMKAIASSNEIVVGRDGVLMSAAGTSAVFLPQVATENHWDQACGSILPQLWGEHREASVHPKETEGNQ